MAACGARPAWGRETSEALLRWSRQETRGLEQDGGQGGSRGRFRERFSDVGAGRLCWQIGCGVRENEVEHDRSPGTLTKASDDFYLHMDGMTMRFFCQALINVFFSFFSDFKSNIDL